MKTTGRFHATVKLQPHESQPTFGVDSKSIYKEWEEDGTRKEFKGLVSALVNPSDEAEFDTAYDGILEDACQEFGIERTRMVYKSFEIYRALQTNPDAARLCVRKIADGLLASKACKVTYVYTHINAKALRLGPSGGGEGQVRVFGEYGSGARHISARAFTDMIEPYHGILAAARVLAAMKLKGARVKLDGLDGLRDCLAWQYLRDNHRVQIFFKGDQTVPEISAADLLVRAALDAARAARSYVDEDRIRELMDPSGTAENLYAYYLGNPHLHDMRPLNDAPLRVGDLLDHIAHPIIFVSGGDQPFMKDVFEGTVAEQEALQRAAGLGGGVKLYNPHLDRQLIGTADTEDYFMPLNEPAQHLLEAIRAVGRRVEELKPPSLPE